MEDDSAETDAAKEEWEALARRLLENSCMDDRAAEGKKKKLKQPILREKSREFCCVVDNLGCALEGGRPQTPSGQSVRWSQGPGPGGAVASPRGPP